MRTSFKLCASWNDVVHESHYPDMFTLSKGYRKMTLSSNYSISNQADQTFRLELPIIKLRPSERKQGLKPSALYLNLQSGLSRGRTHLPVQEAPQIRSRRTESAVEIQAGSSEPLFLDSASRSNRSALRRGVSRHKAR